MMKRFLWLALFIVAGLVTACGGGGSDGTTSGTANTTGITSGVAVDPYISNAHFDELSADDRSVIQSTSSPSDANGAFTFDNALTDGSIIQIKSTEKGQHANAPYEGVIKRQVFAGDSDPVVVSPLTTLLANGMAPSAVVQMLQSAGFGGLSVDDLYTDPMAGLINKTGNLTDADLVLLQANMSVHSFMVANQNFNYGGATTTASEAVAFEDMANLVKDTINPVVYQDLSTAVGADFTVGDLAETAVTINRTVVNQIQQEIQNGATTVSATTIDQYMNNAMADADMIAGDVYQARTGMSGGGTTTPPSNTLDGQTVFTNNTCNSCHTVGTATGMMDLAGDGSLVNSRFSGGTPHNGRTLTADEITAVAAYFDSQGGTTDPGTGTGGGTTTPPSTTPDGQTVFSANNCAGCHTVGTSTGPMDLAGDGAQVDVQFGGGANHNGHTLTADEITAVATYFDSQTGTTDPGAGTGGGTTTPPSTTPDGQTVFSNNNCAGCHTVGTSTGPMDLAGDGAQVDVQFSGGANHNGHTLTADEIAAVATYFDSQSVATDPGTGTTDPGTGTGGTPACGTCHSLPPSSNDTGFQAGAHAVHTALAEVGSDCATCHSGATHNDGWVDLGFPATWDAQAAAALDNMDGTCSNISCHGGQQTPDWTTGNIDVDTQCRSCHASGTAEPNGYFSGQHRRHADSRNISCDTCHDPTKLQNGHFDNLSTAAFEQNPDATIRDSLGYNGRTCQTAGCHGSENW